MRILELRKTLARSIPPGVAAEFQAWIDSRPQAVKDLVAEFPPGLMVETDEGRFYLLGYTENDRLIVSRISPSDDHEASVASREHLCAQHLRDFLRDQAIANQRGKR